MLVEGLYHTREDPASCDVPLVAATTRFISQQDAVARHRHRREREEAMRDSASRRAARISEGQARVALEAIATEFNERSKDAARTARTEANLLIRQHKRDLNLKVFLSYPEPREDSQRDFVRAIENFLENQGLVAQRLGTQNFSHEAPLRAVRELIENCKGLLCIAFRRTKIMKGTMTVRQPDGSYLEQPVDNEWQTSPWCHIETAMAYQMHLPLIILTETQVIKEGILHWGSMTRYMPAFDLGDDEQNYLASKEWHSLSRDWNNKIWRDAGWDDEKHMYFDEEEDAFVA